jgi:hypothetical protein
MADIFAGTVSKAKSIYELAKRFGNSELSLEISNLQMELADVRSAYAALENENRELKEKIRALEKCNEEPPVYKNGAYYSQSGDGPFCTACYDKDKKQIRLSKLKISAGLVNHICPVCKAPYNLNKLI